ncbi:LOW QUALITY PROTEIN: cytoplasmic tyrosine-protein kinase BMX [Geothlypis trichas]
MSTDTSHNRSKISPIHKKRFFVLTKSSTSDYEYDKGILCCITLSFMSSVFKMRSGRKPVLPQGLPPDMPALNMAVAQCSHEHRGNSASQLVRSNKYCVSQENHSDWWKVRDLEGNCLSCGNEGFVPSTYLRKLPWNDDKPRENSNVRKLTLAEKQSIAKHDWYAGNISHGQSEQLLCQKGKEGAFLVQSSAGMYTVSKVSQEFRLYRAQQVSNITYQIMDSCCFLLLPEQYPAFYQLMPFFEALREGNRAWKIRLTNR